MFRGCPFTKFTPYTQYTDKYYMETRMFPLRCWNSLNISYYFSFIYLFLFEIISKKKKNVNKIPLKIIHQVLRIRNSLEKVFFFLFSIWVLLLNVKVCILRLSVLNCTGIHFMCWQVPIYRRIEHKKRREYHKKG